MAFIAPYFWCMCLYDRINHIPYFLGTQQTHETSPLKIRLRWHQHPHLGQLHATNILLVCMPARLLGTQWLCLNHHHHWFLLLLCLHLTRCQHSKMETIQSLYLYIFGNISWCANPIHEQCSNRNEVVHS